MGSLDYPTQNGTKHASFRYLQDLELYKHETPYMIADMEEVPVDQRSNIELEWHHDVPVYDIRQQEKPFNVDEDSFEVWNLDRDPPGENDDKDMIDYVTYLCNALQTKFGAERVICYENAYRKSTNVSKEAEGVDPTSAVNPPISMVHMDHTKSGGIHRIKHHLTEEETNHYLSGDYRVRIFNVWRPCVDVVENHALAFLHPGTVSPDDMFSIDRVTPSYQGQVTYLKYSPAQKWYSVSRQRQNEAVIFLSFDSSGEGQQNFCAHSSFVDVDANKSAPVRKSIESRLIVFTKLEGTS